MKGNKITLSLWMMNFWRCIAEVAELYTYSTQVHVSLQQLSSARHHHHTHMNTQWKVISWNVCALIWGPHNSSWDARIHSPRGFPINCTMNCKSVWLMRSIELNTSQMNEATKLRKCMGLGIEKNHATVNKWQIFFGSKWLSCASDW